MYRADKGIKGALMDSLEKKVTTISDEMRSKAGDNAQHETLNLKGFLIYVQWTVQWDSMGFRGHTLILTSLLV